MLLILISIVTIMNVQRSTPSQHQGPTYRVYGSVTDTHMIGLKEAQLEFKNAKTRFVEHVHADGTFSVSLLSGAYTLNVTAVGFCPYTRDIVITENDANGAFNLTLLDCSDCATMMIDFVEPRIESDAPPPKPVDPQSLVFKYYRESLDDGKSTRLKPSVLFGRRSDLGEFLEYTGLDCPGNEKLAVLQYDGGSLKALKLRFAKEDHKIRGEGEVTVVDQRGVSHGSTVEIDLASQAPLAVIVK